MRIILLFIVFSALCSKTKAQSYQSIDTIKPPSEYENIYNRPLYTDSLTSSFVIFIKKDVKRHKHLNHAEHVLIIEGEGEMTLGNKTFIVKKGDFVFIPKNTWHSVKTSSTIPLKVLSLQAPLFDGKDRIFEN